MTFISWFWFSRQPLFVTISALLLTGCIQNEVSKSLRVHDLKRERTGVAIIKADFHNSKCYGISTYFIARKVDNKSFPYKIETAVETNSEQIVAQIELPAGKYHVVDYACKTGHHIRKLRADRNMKMALLSIQELKYEKSLANFSVGVGEVVNVGHLQIFIDEVKKTFALRVRDINKESYQWLKANRSHLYRNMKKRPMKLARKYDIRFVPPGVSARILKLCKENNKTSADDCIKSIRRDKGFSPNRQQL